MDIDAKELEELLKKAKDGKISKSDLQEIKSIQSMLDQERNEYNSRKKSETDKTVEEKQAELDNITAEFNKMKQEKMSEEERIKAELEDTKRTNEKLMQEISVKKLNILKRGMLDKAELSQEWIDAVSGESEADIEISINSLKERLEKIKTNNTRSAGSSDRENENQGGDDVIKKVNEIIAGWDTQTKDIKQKIVNMDYAGNMVDYVKEVHLGIKKDDKK